MTRGLTGGCQCGAVRYRLNGEATNPHICHCRMCQKAFGSFFAPLVGVDDAEFEITRGQISVFSSSGETDRGFCARCGTPLTFKYRDAPRISVSIGSLDRPDLVTPRDQCGTESRLPYFSELAGLPAAKPTEEEDPVRTARIRATSHQHPDHDTAQWPPVSPDP